MHFFINPRSGVPLYRQLMKQLKTGIAAGILKPDDKIPTVREVALELTINPNTVARAYRELEMEGLLESIQGRGTYVAQGVTPCLQKGETLFQEKVQRLIQEGKQLQLPKEEMEQIFLKILWEGEEWDHEERNRPGS